jgi:hypothetical protein
MGRLSDPPIARSDQFCVAWGWPRKLIGPWCPDREVRARLRRPSDANFGIKNGTSYLAVLAWFLDCQDRKPTAL